MGFLYTWDRIREGRIPTREDLDHMRVVVMEAVQHQPDVVTAFVFGSVMRGDHSPRSDLDLVIACRNDSLERIQALVDSLSKAALALNVVLSTHLHNVSDARAGRHPFGPSYRLTMQRIAREGHAKGFPHQWFQSTCVDVRAEMEAKLHFNSANVRRQAKVFFDAVGENPPLRKMSAWLRQSYYSGERPFHIYMGFARWMLLWKHQYILDDSKEGVVQSFVAERAFGPLHRDFETLLALDDEYDTLLREVSAGQVSSQKYHARVAEMVTSVFIIVTQLLKRACALIHRQAKENRHLSVAA